MTVLLQPGNHVLFERAFTKTAHAVVPALNGMICDGVREGLPQGSIALSNPSEYRRMLAELAGTDESAGSDAAI
ncbi:hypothetical protein ACEWPL_013335 [Roseovarius sp. S1116L3]|uniref:hypothetical protein n=1 Tax=Roseovarius roseus TaxID=3342636 RepID=UPI0037271477